MIAAWLAAAAVASATGAPSARGITLEEAIRTALVKNADVAVASAEVDAAKADRASTYALAGPKVHVDAAWLRWSEPYSIAFAPPPSPALLARHQYTDSLTASVTQPITPLLAIFEGAKLRDLGVDVAKVQQEGARRQTVYDVTEAFYRLLETRALRGVAEKSVAEIAAQVDRAEKFEKQGLIGKNDVLRAQIALAGAKQRLIQADGGIALGSGRLAMLMALPPSTALEPVGAPTVPAAPPAISSDEAETRALASRAEIKEIDGRLSQAKAGRAVAWLRLAPTVAVVGSWQRNRGIAFQQEESQYVGVVASWDVWDWGSTAFGGKAAGARVRQAEAGREKVRDYIALDTRAAHVTFVSALEGLKVAEAAQVQAEENYRIENKRYELAAITTFDVLDAEALLSLSRAQYLTALYESHIAAANLARAMGEGTP